MLTPRRNRVIASPRARRAMRSRGVDPATVRGTGPGGRIVEADVLAAARSGSPRRARVEHVSNVPLVTSTLVACSTFQLQAAADVTGLLEIQRQIAEEVERACGAPPRLADFVLHAMASALRDCPDANCIWQGESRVALPVVNVGLQGQLPAKRRVLVIPQADRLRLLELISRRAELAAAAQAGRLPEAAGQAAFSLCDLSDYRVEQYAAILTPPQTGVLAMGRPATTPAAVEKRSALRQLLCLTLTADPRALAPETAAALLSRVVELLESPFLLLCERLPR